MDKTDNDALGNGDISYADGNDDIDTLEPPAYKMKSNGTHVTLLDHSPEPVAKNEQLDNLVNGEQIQIPCVLKGEQDSYRTNANNVDTKGREDESQPIIELEHEY
jgi:hypothetical protein